MFVKGALHIHSKFSHDGKLTLAAIAQLYRSQGFQFVCISEHSEDMDERKIVALRHECESLSGADFCMVSGVEYSCENALHIVGVGCDRVLDTSNPVRLVGAIREAAAFAVLAHPRRIRWSCSPDLASMLNAVEVWNVRYDGKYLPSPEALDFFNHIKALNPKLLAVAGDDFHGLGGFYPLSVRMSVNSLDRDSVLKELIGGRYSIESQCFRASADSTFSPRTLAYYRTLCLPLHCAKSLRNKLSAQHL